MIADLESAYTAAVEKAGASTVSISVAGAVPGGRARPCTDPGIGCRVGQERHGR